MNPSLPSPNKRPTSLCSFSRTRLERLMREYEEGQHQDETAGSRESGCIIAPSKTGGPTNNVAFEPYHQQSKNVSDRPSIITTTTPTEISSQAATRQNIPVPAERTARLSFQPPKPLHGITTVATTTKTSTTIPSTRNVVLASSKHHPKPQKGDGHTELIEDLGVVVSRLGSANLHGRDDKRTTTLLPPGHRLDHGEDERMMTVVPPRVDHSRNHHQMTLASQTTNHHQLPSAPPPRMNRNHPQHHEQQQFSIRSFPRSSSSRRRMGVGGGGSRRSLASHGSGVSSRRSILSTGSTAYELEHLTTSATSAMSSTSIHASGDVYPERPANPVPFLEQSSLSRSSSLSLDTLGTATNTSGTNPDRRLPVMMTTLTTTATASSPFTNGTDRPGPPQQQQPVARRWNATSARMTTTTTPSRSMPNYYCDNVGGGERCEL